MHSLRSRLMLLVLIALMPAISLTWTGYVEQRELAREQAHAEALRLANTTSYNHTIQIEAARQLLITLARLPQVQEMDEKTCSALFSELVQQYQFYINIGVADREGNLRCSGLPFSPPVNIADRLYFQRALTTGDFALGGYQIGRVTKAPSLNLGYPLQTGPSGEIHGVVFIAMGLEWLSSLSNIGDLPHGSVLTIIDSTATILARVPNDDGLVGKALPEEPLLKAVIAQEKGTVQLPGLDDVSRLYAFVPLGNFESGTYVMVGIPESRAFADVNRQSLRNLSMALLTLISVLFLAWTGSSQLILNRLQLLINVSRGLAAGDYSIRANLPANLGEITQLGIAFDNMAAELEERASAQLNAQREIKESLGRTTALLIVARRLNTRLELPTVLNTVCEETANALHVPAVTISLYNQQTNRFVHSAEFGLPPSYSTQIQPLSESHLAHLIATQMGVTPQGKEQGLLFYPDVLHVPEDPNWQVYKSFGIRTIVSVPMLHGEETIGRINLHTLGNTQEFNQWDVELLLGLADLAAQAIANARLYKQAQDRIGRIQALYAIDQAIISNPGLPASLNVINEQVISALYVDAAAILLYDPNTQRLNYAEGLGFRFPDLVREWERPGEGLAGKALREQKTFSALAPDDFTNLSSYEMMEQEEFVAYFAAPLLSRNEVKGVLEVFCREDMPRDEEWLTFLNSVATQAAIAIDHSQLFQANQQLLEDIRAQARYVQQIMDSVSQGLLLLDPKLHILSVNPAGQTYLETLSNGSTGDLLVSLDGQNTAEFLASSTPGVWRELTSKKGQSVFKIAVYPLEEGPLAGGWVLTIQDITEQRRQEMYAQAQDRLATVGQLAAGIAHDFNNIMGGIVLYLHLLRSRPNLSDQEILYLDTIAEQSKHASNLIHQILDFSRKSVLIRARLDLVPFIKELINLLNRTLSETIVLTLEQRDEARYIVNADPTRIQQALLNLAINASHAMPHGGHLKFTLSRFALTHENVPPVPDMAPGKWIRIDIADTGTGIAPEDLPHIFDPFFSTKEPGEGTGLGLSQVHGIVGQHDGHILVNSVIGEGTVFSLYLPEEPERQGEAVIIDRHDVYASNETILLVEDNQFVREATESTLSSLGYQVLTAGNGIEALDLFTKHRKQVDLVLSDLVMPGMGGVELFNSLKLAHPKIKMVIMTGYPLDQQEQSWLQDGIVDWINKPFTPEEIAAKIRAALEQAGP